MIKKNKSISTDSCCSGMEMENALKLLFQHLKYFPWDSNCSGLAHKIKIDMKGTYLKEQSLMVSEMKMLRENEL